MFSLKTILAAAATVAVAFAQAESPIVAITSYPAVAVVGNSYNITWGGGDGTPVTLTLRQGSPNNLDTVTTLASQLSGPSYEWLVSDSLATASNYALQITQGQSGINYSGLFSIVGGTGSSSISYSGLATSTGNSTITAAAATMTDSAPSVGTGTDMPRNTTFVSQKLTSHSITSAPTRATSAAQSASASASSNIAVAPGAAMGSSAAMVMGLFGAIMFLQ